MFMTHLKTALVDAMRQTLDAEYPEGDFRDIRVSIEYPVEQEDYPSIWVDFHATANLEIAGINHREYDVGDADESRPFSRWRFQGAASYTAVALTSLERDRLLDQLIRIMAFGHEQPETSEFRSLIESNDFIAMNFDFDKITVSGTAATPGTPWGTEEMVYEASIQMDCIGEFVSEGAALTLVPLREVVTYPLGPADPEPVPSDGWM